MNQDYIVTDNAPNEDEYAELREEAADGWPLGKEETPVQDADFMVTVRKKDTDELVGFGSVRKKYDGVSLEYYDLLVNPEHESNGIGTEITERIIKWAKQYLDETEQSWIALRAKVRRGMNSYYEEFGFETVCQTENRNEMRRKIQ